MDTIELLNSVSEAFPNTYQSVSWLGTPLESLNYSRPADLIRRGDIDEVYAALKDCS